MEVGFLKHILLFLAGCYILWKSSGLVVGGVQGVSKNLKSASFVVSFFLLGILTSLGEVSVGVNALLQNEPEIFVGNLIGGCFVLLVFIIPILAILNDGIKLKGQLDKKKLIYFLTAILAPSFFVFKGEIIVFDAITLIVLYLLFFYIFSEEVAGRLDEVSKPELTGSSLWINLFKIFTGAILIFLSSKVLVDETIFLAELFKVPTFLVSLIILSLGTNIPEITIAIKALQSKQPNIAFGDYVGSAAANVLIFGIMSLIHGDYKVSESGFNLTFFVFMFGYILFFLFAKSKRFISRQEGIILMLVYLFFLMIQVSDLFIFADR